MFGPFFRKNVAPQVLFLLYISTAVICQQDWIIKRNTNNIYGRCDSPTSCEDGVSHLGKVTSLEKCQTLATQSESAMNRIVRAVIIGMFVTMGFCFMSIVCGSGMNP